MLNIQIEKLKQLLNKAYQMGAFDLKDGFLKFSNDENKFIGSNEAQLNDDFEKIIGELK